MKKEKKKLSFWLLITEGMAIVIPDNATEMLQYRKMSKVMTALITCFVMSIIMAGCSGESPSMVVDKFLNAVVKKDYKTAAKYTYTIQFTDTNIEKANEAIAKFFEERKLWADLWKYEIKDEQISANGESAVVTVYGIFERQIANNEQGSDKNIFLIKTKTAGWKIDFDKNSD